MSSDITRSSAKRRRIVENEDDDDDDDGKAGKQSLASPTGTNGHSRLVLLSVRTSNSTDVKFAVDEGVVRLIPDYAKKLDSAILLDPEARRLQISDEKIRKEEVIVQAIEYLLFDTLESLDPSKPEEFQKKSPRPPRSLQVEHLAGDPWT